MWLAKVAGFDGHQIASGSLGALWLSYPVGSWSSDLGMSLNISCLLDAAWASYCTQGCDASIGFECLHLFLIGFARWWGPAILLNLGTESYGINNTTLTHWNEACCLWCVKCQLSRVLEQLPQPVEGVWLPCRAAPGIMTWSNMARLCFHLSIFHVNDWIISIPLLIWWNWIAVSFFIFH